VSNRARHLTASAATPTGHEEAVESKTYRVKHLCAIVCRETAYKWLKWTDQHDVETIMARCVFDASGDVPGTRRGAFPVNTAAFRARYGNQFTKLLIEEANETRRMQGLLDKSWVYKGYGIFQYDLQNVRTDEAFSDKSSGIRSRPASTGVARSSTRSSWRRAAICGEQSRPTTEAVPRPNDMPQTSRYLRPIAPK
jgi:hypothetical protein